MSSKLQKVMVQPINLIFKFLQQKSRVQVWLFEQTEIRIEGQIIGFDEFMNLVMDNAEELTVKTGARKQVGRILLKGDNITLMYSSESELGILDLIQVFVEALDRTFVNVCELDLIFRPEDVLQILGEIISGGLVLETNINEILSATQLPKSTAMSHR
eukprot:jgi/Hompol1/1720/HPOL_000259-RA